MARLYYRATLTGAQVIFMSRESADNERFIRCIYDHMAVYQAVLLNF